jgi:hypothetical protein
MNKTQICIKIDQELLEFVKQYAKENYTTLTAVVVQQLVKLKKEYELYKRNQEQLLNNLSF